MRLFGALLPLMMGVYSAEIRSTTLNLKEMQICMALDCQGYVEQTDASRVDGEAILCDSCTPGTEWVDASAPKSSMELPGLIPLGVSMIDTEDETAQEILASQYPKHKFKDTLSFPLRHRSTNPWIVLKPFVEKTAGSDGGVKKIGLSECAPIKSPSIEGDYVSVTTIGVIQYVPMKRKRRAPKLFMLGRTYIEDHQGRLLVSLARTHPNRIFETQKTLRWAKPNRGHTVFIASQRNISVTTPIDPTTLSLTITCLDSYEENCYTRHFYGWIGFFCPRSTADDLQQIESALRQLQKRHKAARDQINNLIPPPPYYPEQPSPYTMHPYPATAASPFYPPYVSSPPLYPPSQPFFSSTQGIPYRSGYPPGYPDGYPSGYYPAGYPNFHSNFHHSWPYSSLYSI